MDNILPVVLTLCLVGQLSPGPDMLLLVRHSAGRPLRYPLTCMLGIGLGLAIHLSMAVLGLGWILSTLPKVLQLIQCLGAGYLIYLGWKAWSANHTANLSAGRSEAMASNWYCLSEGLVCNLLNPKVILFMLSLFTQVITPETLLSDKLLIACAILTEALVIWFLFVIGLNIPRVQALFKQHLHRLNQLAGLLFVGLGAGLLWTV
jgi:threonine/homoserine/homoserine lactone efflux protein